MRRLTVIRSVATVVTPSPRPIGQRVPLSPSLTNQRLRDGMKHTALRQRLEKRESRESNKLWQQQQNRPKPSRPSPIPIATTLRPGSGRVRGDPQDRASPSHHGTVTAATRSRSRSWSLRAGRPRRPCGRLQTAISRAFIVSAGQTLSTIDLVRR